MKAKVIIEHGIQKIVLTPENEFKNDIISKNYNKKQDISVDFTTKYEK